MHGGCGDPTEAGLPTMTSRTNWSEVDTKMQSQFTSLAEEIKGQLQTMTQDLKNVQQPHTRTSTHSADGREMKAVDGDMSMRTPRGLSIELMAEKEKAQEAQEIAEAKKQEAEEAVRKAEQVGAQIEIQKKTEEDLQHRLTQQERVHERTIQECVSQTHSREAELKMLVKSQATRLEQMEFQMKTNSRENTRENTFTGSTGSGGSSFWDCAGHRDRNCGPNVGRSGSAPGSSRGHATNGTSMVHGLADGTGGRASYPLLPESRPGSRPASRPGSARPDYGYGRNGPDYR